MNVAPSRPASEYLVDPYPGDRPTGSWVIDRNEHCVPVVPDEGVPSGWAVLPGAGRLCLDAWLVAQGATPLAGRVPLLSYGSNACPGKILMNGTPLPVVSLACEMAGLASAWCTGRTRAGRLPATLAAAPGHVESAVVTMADHAELARLDVIEGRSTGWYALQLLHTGRVTLENGARVPRPAAYVGARPERHPALLNGRPHLRTVSPLPDPTTPAPVGGAASSVGADLPQAGSGPTPVGDAVALAAHPPSFPDLSPRPIGDEVPPGVHPHPGECVPAVFTYGTLMPGQIRAHQLTGRLSAEPWDAVVFGDLRDTGLGYPALNASADRKAPGVLYELRPEVMAQTLARLDEVEGTAVHLYSRQLRNVGGMLAWVYLADRCAGLGIPIDAWR